MQKPAQSVEMEKVAGLKPPVQGPSIAPNQASLLSLLCLIAGSVLASSTNNELAAKLGAQCLQITAASSEASDRHNLHPTDDVISEPDPPEVAPEGHSTDRAAIKTEEGGPAESPPAGKCKNCAAKHQESEATVTPAQLPGVFQSTTGATPEPAASPKPVEPAGPSDVPGAEKPLAEDKPTTETQSASDDKPASDGQTTPEAKPALEVKTSAEVASVAEPQTPIKEVAASDEIPAEGTSSAEDGAAATGGDVAVENAKAENAAGDEAAGSGETTEETAKTEEAAVALELPDWFLGNNVILYEDLNNRPSTLQLFKAKVKAKVNNKPENKNVDKAGEDEVDKKTDEKSAQNETAKETSSISNSDSASDSALAEKSEKVCSCKTTTTTASDASTQIEAARPEKPAETNGSSSQNPVYQLHQEIYDEALDLLSAALQPPAQTESTDGVKKTPPESWITPSSFLLQSPRDGSLEFLDEVVRQIGRDVQADIVMLDLDDLEDLCQHFWHDSDELKAVGSQELTSPLRLVGEFFGYSKPEEKSKAGLACVLAGADRKRESLAQTAITANGSSETAAGKVAEATTGNAVAVSGEKLSTAAVEQSQVAADILQAGVKEAFDAATKILQAAIREAFVAAPKPENGSGPDSKSSTPAHTATQDTSNKESVSVEKQESPAKSRPLIILFRNAETVCRQTPLQRLCEGVNTLRREKGIPVVVVGTAVSTSTSDDKPTTGISKVWDGMQLNDSTVINVVPRNTRRAAEALKRNGARTKPRATWRLLRRSIRVTLEQHPKVSVEALYPSGSPAGELVVDELEDEGRRQTLADWDENLSARVVRQVSARAVRAGAVTPADVFDVMERVMRNQAIINKMNEAGDDEFVGEDGSGDEVEVEFGGPAKKSQVQTLLDSISGSCSEAEKEYFDCVVDTGAMSSTNDDIHMDKNLMDSLKQLLSLRTSKPYGLLAKESINGAILYGPPGTGKTHLARVVAATSGTNLIVATPADLQNMWVGETEKRIKALFSLGTKLSPCVVFLDEGDSIFGRRGALDREYQRKAMSQFLMEMDGLVSRKKAPFLIVATNRPGDIDEAMCRRLPHTLHIGMPTAAGRRAILDIYLKEEKLDEGLDLDQVAADSMTKGFSGSDIRTLCVQAAMAAHKALLEAEGQDGKAGDLAAGSQKRVITMEHFRTALERTRPSVTRESLMEIERFTGQQESGDHNAMYI